MSGDPIAGQPLLVAGAKAGVGPALLPDLVEHVQAHLGPRIETYRREYERVHAADGHEVFLVEEGHWANVADAVGLAERERTAVERAHVEHLRYLGRRGERTDEFESALDIREVVVVGRDPEAAPRDPAGPD